MLFNTFPFILFLPTIVILFYVCPPKFRWAILLIGSYFFYMLWKPAYALLIAGSTIIDYVIGIYLGKSSLEAIRRLLLMISLIINLGTLYLFKYLNFSIDIANELGFDFQHTDWILPVGISFYTFQTMSYTIDVYQRKVLPAKHLGQFALYVSFFPQLVAGPIERYTHLAPQLKSFVNLKYENIAGGGRLILYGLFIKMVIADNLAPLVELVFDNPQKWNALSIVGGMFFYSMQIYSDFYGYSLVAIGSALLLGVHIMNNFQAPYFSTGIVEFWKRWHISLSTWFRDYLYFPLGGNRVSRLRWILNILVIFMVSGIWHGANFTFILWGAIHALLYLIESILVSKEFLERKRFTKFLVVASTFVLVTAAWVFFRAKTIKDALLMYKSIESPGEESLRIAPYIWVFLFFFVLSDFLFRNTRFDLYVHLQKIWIRWVVYFVLIFSIIQFAGVQQSPFIYFQF